MKGVILCGGLGTRLGTLTQITNKHLLPIYDRPMIYYPIETLVKAGIRDLMVIVSGPHSGDFVPILQNGKQFGLDHIEYAYQSRPDGGIADALALAEDFADGGKIAVILGDNTMDSEKVSTDILDFNREGVDGAHVFIKLVDDPQNFGVPKLDKFGKIIDIIEKPIDPPSSFAVIGLYLYDSTVFKYIKLCSPSERGQLEITDVNTFYLKDGKLGMSVFDGFWKDAGTYENLFLANQYWYHKRSK